MGIIFYIIIISFMVIGGILFIYFYNKEGKAQDTMINDLYDRVEALERKLNYIESIRLPHIEDTIEEPKK